MDLEYQKRWFENHVATLTDYGNIKILDFKNPDTNHYRIRFIFEEDYYRIHISGDIGELIAYKYDMNYDKFFRFINNTGYFEPSVCCCNRPIHTYDSELAGKQIIKWLKDTDQYDDIINDSWDNEYDDEDSFLDDVLDDFDDKSGLGERGKDILIRVDESSDIYDELSSFGLEEEPGILDLYMLAFKLATDQLKKENGAINE